ncbi:hypothetical protein [Actinomadura sp. NEAU-AAG7]|uniref:hypothetical protein n=1 Tax=Actinomadura sp. NEAU-AAG7 TaxID=2839640 RepID=UPI001BE4BDEA|nr:hypothetical protein [Actinomadura sp. NEAU-AAG7]MBT2208596.1 hypothetical protein [Actinomadura sp. NEAU-AAG7]
MSPHSPARRRALTTALTTAAVTVPLLTTLPADAAPCSVGRDGKVHCNADSHQSGGTSGGGAGGGSGGGGGPVAPPDPDGLTPDQGVGYVPVDGGGAAPPAAAPPTTWELVESAMASANLTIPKVHIAPAGKTYVRLRTALWIDGVQDVKTEPIGAPRLQATATADRVEWNVGEKTFECDGTKGQRCHYTYRRSSTGQPGGSYQITATIKWHVTWRCELAGCTPPSGDLGERTTTSLPVPLTVSEIQTNTGQ